jgi:phage tail-like protein
MPGFADVFDSAGTHRFSFSLDGIEDKQVKSVDTVSLKIDKVETKSVTFDGKPIHKAWAGNKTWLGQLSVTRVMTDNPVWQKWYNDAANGDMKSARKHGVIMIYSPDIMNPVPVRSYTFQNAWPVELKVTGMNASSSAPVEETVTFVYESMTMEIM